MKQRPCPTPPRPIWAGNKSFRIGGVRRTIIAVNASNRFRVGTIIFICRFFFFFAKQILPKFYRQFFLPIA
jgi:hypothetical protein